MEKLRKVIVPAIIAKSQKELEQKINKVKSISKLIQLDIMDGKFVKNTSLNFDFKLPKSKCRYEAHLMVKNPENWIKKNYKKVSTIIVHAESSNRLNELISLINSKGKKVGLALRPETSVSKVINHLNGLNQVLILTVHPGFYGRKFISKALNKASRLRKIRSRLNIEVDGGINPLTIKKADKAGANMFVSGSYLVNSININSSLENLKRSIK